MGIIINFNKYRNMIYKPDLPMFISEFPFVRSDDILLLNDFKTNQRVTLSATFNANR